MFKLLNNCAHFTLVRLCAKSFKLGFSSTWTENFPDVQAGFIKGRGTKDQTANICWITEEAPESQKNIYFCFIHYKKAFNCVDHNQLWKIVKRWEYQTTLLVSWETVCKKQQLELDMEQQSGFKLGKLYIVKAVHCYPAYLTSMYSTWCEISGWMNHKLESWPPREISTTSDMQIIPL